MNFDNTAVLAMRYIARALRALRYDEGVPPLTEGLDWHAVFAMAKKHTVDSSLWYLLEPAVRATGETALIDNWEGSRTMDFAKNLVQTREFAALTAIFTENKIPFLPMKGFLFKELWARPEHRTMADMDFLVRECDLARVGELLLARGYRVDVEEGEVHDTYDKPPYLHVEVHRSLFPRDTDGFEKWTPREDNPYWYVMSPEDFLVFNVGHIHKHFVSGGCGARSLFDVYLYLRERGDTLDMPLVEKKLREKGLEGFYIRMLHLICFWFADGEYPFVTDPLYVVDGKPTAELLESEYFIITGGAYGSEKNRVEYQLARKSKLRYLFEISFPPYRVMWHHYPVLKKWKILLPFAYVYRFFAYLASGKVKRFVKYIFGRREKK